MCLRVRSVRIAFCKARFRCFRSWHGNRCSSGIRISNTATRPRPGSGLESHTGITKKLSALPEHCNKVLLLLWRKARRLSVHFFVLQSLNALFPVSFEPPAHCAASHAKSLCYANCPPTFIRPSAKEGLLVAVAAGSLTGLSWLFCISLRTTGVVPA